MSSFLTAINQDTDPWHCRLVPDNGWDGENPPEQPMVCDDLYEPLPPNVIKTGNLDGNNIYLSIQALEQGDLVGSWDNEGNILLPVDPLFDNLVPVGNEKGNATNELSYQGWQGHAIRHRQEADGLPEYPVDDQPFAVKMERYERVDQWAGWSWRATIEFSDPNRAPDARAIGIYPDGDWDAAGWTTGAFVWTEIGRDADENPIMGWQTECPPGRETPTKEPLYYALLHGSAHEGRMILPEGQESLERLFWEHDKPSTGGEEWVTIIAVTNGMAGAVVLTAPDNAEIPDGSLVKIDGVESTVTSLWTTGGINLDPYQAYASDLAIEVWK